MSRGLNISTGRTCWEDDVSDDESALGRRFPGKRTTMSFKMAEKYQFDARAQVSQNIDVRPGPDELVTPGWGDYFQSGWGKLNKLSTTVRGDKALLALSANPTVNITGVSSTPCGDGSSRRELRSLYSRPQGGISFYAPPPKDDDLPGTLKSPPVPIQINALQDCFKSNPLGFDELLRETQGFSCTAVDGQALQEALKDESTPRLKTRLQKLNHVSAPPLPPSEAMASLTVGTKRKATRSDEDLRELVSRNTQTDINKRRRYNYVLTGDIPMDGNTQSFYETKGGRSPKQYMCGTSKMRRGLRTAASSATAVLKSPFIWWKRATEPRKTIVIPNFDIPKSTVSFSDRRDTFIIGGGKDVDMSGV
ncbi:hypothetical protein K491DRAFT_678626 [Lophiostoma macrostomum CBS 122681]|uniref:Uncharacterized protein n=1 Tax=Lophiostoma macrostomum CBS 122681 TaxID=1314788 RepID=A0A6A6TAT1_9PLEO|nr:hypothetical protein K491DRAFT_678626 [Lophiostoma macrostomum CBS 122681]